jgi:hypothetical protein
LIGLSSDVTGTVGGNATGHFVRPCVLSGLRALQLKIACECRCRGSAAFRNPITIASPT